jgi:hypothetical protein
MMEGFSIVIAIVVMAFHKSDFRSTAELNLSPSLRDTYYCRRVTLNMMFDNERSQYA